MITWSLSLNRQVQVLLGQKLQKFISFLMHSIVKIQCATPYDKDKTDISYIHEKENGHYITFPQSILILAHTLLSLR